MGEMHLLQPLRHVLPHGIDMGVMFSYLRGVLYSQGFVRGNSRSVRVCTAYTAPRWT